MKPHHFLLTVCLVIVGLVVYSHIRVESDQAATADSLRSLGDSHFSAHEIDQYDLAAAKKYYSEALVLDPEIIGVHDQLARIAFIEGKLEEAKAHINEEIARSGTNERNLYYIRGLIYAYAQDYAQAEDDYAYHFRLRPLSWASHVDYAWVLLKRQKTSDAIPVLARGLELHPDNPWLLNVNGVALFELGFLQPALDSFRLAESASEKVSEKDWLVAYPGNDPRTASVGVVTLKESIASNIHRVEQALLEP